MTDLESADLTGAALRSANLHSTNMRDVNLELADLRDADLRHLSWKSDDGPIIKSIKLANIARIKNAPEGFREWALENGAVEKSQDEWDAINGAAKEDGRGPWRSMNRNS